MKPAPRGVSARSIRALAVVALVSCGALVLAPVGPAFAVSVCGRYTGTIRDGHGQGVAGAVITTPPTDPPCTAWPQSATSDADGRYSVGGQYPSTTATVVASGFVTAYQTVSSTNFDNDVRLYYTSARSVTPDVVRPGETVTASIVSTVPPETGPRAFVCAWGTTYDSRYRPLPGAAQNNRPVPVSNATARSVLSDVVMASARNLHSLVLGSDGTVAAWGGNALGQLGDGTTTTRATPALVLDPSSGNLRDVVAVAAGWTHSLALRSDGTVVAWGENKYGELGDGTKSRRTRPIVVKGVGGTGVLTGISEIAAGWGISYARTTGGRIYAWGSNSSGELGDGTTVDRLTPVEVKGANGTGPLTDVVDIAAGIASAYAVLADGTGWSWGWNANGELGTGDTENRALPTKIVGVDGDPELIGVVGIEATNARAIARHADGHLSAWGWNGDGELGDGTNEERLAPVLVLGIGTSARLEPVSSVALGVWTSYAVLSDGTAVAWGWNGNGEFGNGSSAGSSRPQVVLAPSGADPLSGIEWLAAGSEFAFAQSSSACRPTHPAVKAVVATSFSPNSTLPFQESRVDGTFVWSGPVDVPSGTPDGQKSVTTCVRVASAPGNYCSGDTLLTTSGDTTFRVDGSPPKVISTSTGRYGTVLAAPSVSVTWLDAGTAVVGSSVTMKLDGASVPVSVSGFGSVVVASTSGVTITPGLHLVETSAQDSQGLTGSDRFVFSLATVTADPAIATVPTKTVSVNPSGAIPGPSTVRFSQLAATSSAFDEQISVATRAGRGQLRRAVAFPQTVVRFRNDVGLETTVNVNVPSIDMLQDTAVLTPSAAPLQARIPSTTAGMPDLVVPVPIGYNTSGSTAKLETVTGTLGPVTASAGTLFGTSLTGKVPISGSLTACMERRADGGQPTVARCTAEHAPVIEATVAGVSIPVFRPVNADPDETPHSTYDPSCTVLATGEPCANPFGMADPWAQDVHASTRFGCPSYHFDLAQVDLSLCDLQPTVTTSELFGAHLNGWVFGGDADTYPVWFQNHVEPNVAPCPSGRPGTVSTTLYRASNVASSLDGAAGPVTAGIFKRYTDDRQTSHRLDELGNLVVWPLSRLGSVSDASAASSEAAGPIASTTAYGYLIEPRPELEVMTSPAQLGYYGVYDGTAVDPQGRSVSGAFGTNLWSAHDPAANPPALGTSSTATQLDEPLQLVGGTVFASPAPAGGYALATSLNFQFTVDVSGCGSVPS